MLTLRMVPGFGPVLFISSGDLRSGEGDPAPITISPFFSFPGIDFVEAGSLDRVRLGR